MNGSLTDRLLTSGYNAASASDDSRLATGEGQHKGDPRSPLPAGSSSSDIIELTRMLGSLARSGSSRATGSYQSLWSQAASVATMASSLGLVDFPHEGYEAGSVGGAPMDACSHALLVGDEDDTEVPSPYPSSHAQSESSYASSVFSESRAISSRPSSATSSEHDPIVSWKPRGSLSSRHGPEGPEIPETSSRKAMVSTSPTRLRDQGCKERTGRTERWRLALMTMGRGLVRGN